MYDCIPLSTKDIGLVNSIYSVGGFLTALIAGPVADAWGRKKVAFGAALLLIVGSWFASQAETVKYMSVGRLVSGLGAGFAIVITPIYLNEISPAPLRGLFGTMNQVSICAGILLSQIIGLYYSTETEWRFILRGGAYVAIINAILVPFCQESPKWLTLKGMTTQATRMLVELRGTTDVEDEIYRWRQADEASTESDGLLGNNDITEQHEPADKVTVLDFLTLPEYRRALVAVVGVMSFQQLSGINAIIFYGVSILSATMPQYSRLINCFISLLNLVVTLLISPFVDKFGRRPLLMLSLTGMAISSTLLGLGILGHISTVSSLAAALFVASFAVGLGPVPFLIVSELAPAPAVGVAQSTAATANWIVTFLIVFIFPLLESFLGDFTFFVFTITGILGMLFIHRCIPETKGKASYKEVWAGFN